MKKLITGTTVMEHGGVGAAVRRERGKWRLDFSYRGAKRYLGSYVTGEAAINAALGMLERGEAKALFTRRTK